MSEETFSPLTVTNYSRQASLTDKVSSESSLTFPLLGLIGETGSLLAEVKKKQRDKIAYRGYAAATVEEMGDVLWYLNAIALHGSVTLVEIFAELNNDIRDDNELTFSALQSPLAPQSNEPTKAFEDTLLKLAHEVGELIGEYQSNRLGSQSVLRHRLSQIARLLVSAADEAGITLEAAAVKNLHKINDRWPSVLMIPAPLDDNSVLEEQLPRALTIDIFERQVGDRVYVFQQCNGVNIGDRLTDNARWADDYRFHDVFHMAYVAVLTWSPVMRSLLRLKRKSAPAIDEAEDGARAKLIEEGITTWIFTQAKELDFFEGVSSGELSFDLLKNVRQFVAGYESEACPLWLWEDAILQGYAAFRYLRKHRRGRITMNIEKRSLTIGPLPQ